MRYGKQLAAQPFEPSCVFDLPLQPELCQQIYATALLRLARDQVDVAPPSVLPAASLHEQICRYGREVCLLNPAACARIFQGVTLAVYQAIEALYCSRLGRSVQMVARIVHAMARAKQWDAPDLTDEAIWAICLSFEDAKRAATAVTIQQDPSAWWVGEIALVPPAETTAPEDDTASLFVAGVIDMTHSCVLALQTGERTASEHVRGCVLYDALCAMRQPAKLGAAGLIWSLPTSIDAEGLSSSCCKIWSDALGIPIERASRSFPFLKELRLLWSQVCARRGLSLDRRAVLFESALNSAYGTSPLRTREEHESSNIRLHGYMTDPAWLFPALHTLLPAIPARISQDGTVTCHGLHYADELLAYWPHAPVIVRPSAWTEAVAWIYLDGEILCQAQARELMRRDGSALPHFVRR